MNMCMRMNERMNMRVYACGCPCSHVDAMWMLLTQYSCCIQTIPNLHLRSVCVCVWGQLRLRCRCRFDVQRCHRWKLDQRKV